SGTKTRRPETLWQEPGRGNVGRRPTLAETPKTETRNQKKSPKQKKPEKKPASTLGLGFRAFFRISGFGFLVFCSSNRVLKRKMTRTPPPFSPKIEPSAFFVSLQRCL